MNDLAQRFGQNPTLSPESGLEVLQFDSGDSRFVLSDPCVTHFHGRDYLTTLSHLRLLASDDGVHSAAPEPSLPLMRTVELETYGIEDRGVAKIDETYCLRTVS